MTKRKLEENWIIEQVKAAQALGCTQPELDLRHLFAMKFNVKLDWAYQLIRDVCQKNPHLHLEKVPVEYGDGTTHMEFEVTWRD